MFRRERWLDGKKYWRITQLGVPMVLSNAGLVFMQFVDAMFLAEYSSDAIAASGMGGMVSWMVSSLFVGLVSYTSVVTANNIGAGQEDKIGSVNWQGIYLALGAGVITVCLGFHTDFIFRVIGHDVAIQSLESEYLRALLFGNVTVFLVSALGGFFSGRGDNIRLMLAQMTGQFLNIGLDYVMIFGKFGFPEMGVSGAAWATVLSNLLPLAIMFYYFLRRDNRERYHTSHWRLHPGIAAKLIRFGFASGVMMCIDASLWTVFMVVVGRLGTVELAATSIAFRLNALAFMPVVGLARGMGTLVGQRHGARDHEGVIDYMCHGLVMAEGWMILVACTYVFCPNIYFNWFSNDGSRGTVSFADVLAVGRILLCFVAAYCVGDAVNIVLSTGLTSVGDTHWTSVMMSVVTFTLIGVLFVADYFAWGLYAIWSIAVVFIMSFPLMWVYRIRRGVWKDIRVATD